jgi:hypothetical protein
MNRAPRIIARPQHLIRASQDMLPRPLRRPPERLARYSGDPDLITIDLITPATQPLYTTHLQPCPTKAERPRPRPVPALVHRHKHPRPQKRDHSQYHAPPVPVVSQTSLQNLQFLCTRLLPPPQHTLHRQLRVDICVKPISPSARYSGALQSQCNSRALGTEPAIATKAQDRVHILRGVAFFDRMLFRLLAPCLFSF